MDRCALPFPPVTLRSLQFLPVFSAGFLLVTYLTAPVCAKMPSVRFDIPHRVACRDVTTDDFAAVYPGDRLLEAEFELSTLLVAGDERDLLQFIYRIASPHRSLQVVDYLPKTTLASEYASSIGVERKQERTKSAGLAVNGSWQHLLNATGSGDLSSKDSAAVRYELVAPLQPLTASGTIQRGSGVYFKLKPSSQASFEGSKSFTLVFRAPHAWRGDYVQVYCEASGVRRGVVRPLDEVVTCGMRDFFVALYLPADEEAKAAANRLVQRERALQNLLLSHRDEIAAASRHNVIRSFAAIFEPHDTAAQQSLKRLLYSHRDGDSDSIPTNLPQPLRTAVAEYLAARAAMRELNGQ